MRRKRARVRRSEANVVASIPFKISQNTLVQGLRRPSPKDPDQPLVPSHGLVQNTGHHFFPALPGVCAGPSHLGGERGVEHEDALLRPVLKICRSLQGESQIGSALLKHVAQRGRPRQQWVRHAEGQAMRLTHAVVRILAEQHHAHLFWRGTLQRMPHLVQRWTQLSLMLQFKEFLDPRTVLRMTPRMAPLRQARPPRGRRLGPTWRVQRHLEFARFVENLCGVLPPQAFNGPI